MEITSNHSNTMRSLLPHHITEIFCFVDDLLPTPPRPKGGRPVILRHSEVITILIWNMLVFHEKTLKGIHQKIEMYHRRDFPRFPKYKGFVVQCHRALPLLVYTLGSLLATESPVRILDSTMLPVCKLIRADTHKVAQDIAQFGKNHQGWHFGFKLHASISITGNLCSVVITPANMHDAQMMPKILNAHTRYAVGDSHYGAKVMGRAMWEKYGTIIIAPPHFTQKRKVMTDWQEFLLRTRSKIESVFDYLKEHLHLVSSFPRSVNGYLLHYVATLLGYVGERGF